MNYIYKFGLLDILKNLFISIYKYLLTFNFLNNLIEIFLKVYLILKCI